VQPGKIKVCHLFGFGSSFFFLDILLVSYQVKSPISHSFCLFFCGYAMSAPGFGFSVGDFFAALQLIGKISTALKNSGGAADDYQSLRIELQQLQLLLEQLRDLPTASTSSLNHYNAVRGMACQVQIPLRDFVNKMRSYHEKLGVSNDQPAWRSAKRKMQWAISMREDVREMRAVVTMKIVSVSVLLTIPIG